MKYLTIISVFLSACGMTLNANECCCDPCSTDNIAHFYLGPQVYYVDLDIRNGDSDVPGLDGLFDYKSKLHGVFYGGNAGFQYRQSCGIFFNVDLNYGQGKLKKNGHNRSRYVHEYEGNAVIGYQLGGGIFDCWKATGYVGIDYLTQNYSVADQHIKFRYSFYRIPVGIELKYWFMVCNYRWSIGVNGLVLPQVDSSVKINFLKGARWTLGKRTDWIVTLPINYYSDCCPLGVQLTLFWKRLGIGSSKAVSPGGNTLGLPSSKWNAWGGLLDVTLEF